MTLDQRVQQNAMNERMGATLAMPVAVLAARLAFVGVYSLFAYAVLRRTREIGVRLAVGASPGAVLRMVLRESVTVTAIGVALGVPTGIIYRASEMPASGLARSPAYRSGLDC